VNVGTELEIDVLSAAETVGLFLKGKVMRLEEAPGMSGDRAPYHVNVAFVTDDEEARSGWRV
jgi:hypothetical protein